MTELVTTDLADEVRFAALLGKTAGRGALAGYAADYLTKARELDALGLDKAVVAELLKVGPKGYEHGWIFVGVPGVGADVFHPHHGRGKVTRAGKRTVGVQFDSGHYAAFEHGLRGEHPRAGEAGNEHFAERIDRRKGPRKPKTETPPAAAPRSAPAKPSTPTTEQTHAHLMDLSAAHDTAGLKEHVAGLSDEQINAGLEHTRNLPVKERFRGEENVSADVHNTLAAERRRRRMAAGLTPSTRKPDPEGQLTPETQHATRQVRGAYDRALTRRGGKQGDWVGLADLREEMAADGMGRGEQDAALRQIVRSGQSQQLGFLLEEETNQKTLTPRDRAAAINVGQRDQHVVAFREPEAPREPRPERAYTSPWQHLEDAHAAIREGNHEQAVNHLLAAERAAPDQASRDRIAQMRRDLAGRVMGKPGKPAETPKVPKPSGQMTDKERRAALDRLREGAPPIDRAKWAKAGEDARHEEIHSLGDRISDWRGGGAHEVHALDEQRGNLARTVGSARAERADTVATAAYLRGAAADSSRHPHDRALAAQHAERLESRAAELDQQARDAQAALDRGKANHRLLVEANQVNSGRRHALGGSDTPWAEREQAGIESRIRREFGIDKPGSDTSPVAYSLIRHEQAAASAERDAKLADTRATDIEHLVGQASNPAVRDILSANAKSFRDAETYHRRQAAEHTAAASALRNGRYRYEVRSGRNKFGPSHTVYQIDQNGNETDLSHHMRESDAQARAARLGEQEATRLGTATPTGTSGPAPKGPKPRSKAKPVDAAGVVATLGQARSRDEARQALTGLTGDQLRQVAAHGGTTLTGRRKDQMVNDLVEHHAGRRLDSEAVSRGLGGGTSDAAARRAEAATARLEAGKPTVKAEAAFAGLLVKTAGGALAVYAAERLDEANTAGVDLAKFDPSEARDVTGRWSAGGSNTTTTTVTNRPEDRARARQQHQDAADARTADSNSRTAAAARLAGTNLPTPAKGAGAAEVKAARARYRIPSGKKLARLPRDQQQAAANILGATRDLARLRAAQARAKAQLAAVQHELAAPNLGPKTEAFLQHRQEAVQAKLADLGRQAAVSQRQLTAGRKAWHGRK